MSTLKKSLTEVLSYGLNLFLLGVIFTTSFGTVNTEVDFNPTVKPNVTPNVTKEVHRDAVLLNNNIQANHEDTEFEVEADTLRLEEVDRCSQLYGASMQPTIFDGHHVCLRKYDGGDIEEGTIIRYEKQSSDTSIIHRVEGSYLEDGYLLTRGDNNRYRDSRVDRSQVTHVAVATIYS